MQNIDALNQAAIRFMGIPGLSRNIAGLFILLLVLLNFFVFFPSFFHTARGADHYGYLTETAGNNSLGMLLERSYSYTRTRLLSAGDKILFRPLFYVYLAFAQWLYGYDFFYWQLTAFILHLIVQWKMFRLLNMFGFSIWSVPLVLLNSVMLLSQEMVIRHHLTGYLLFEIFALAAISRLIRYLKDDVLDEQHFSFMILWLLLACLAYEFGVVMNLIIIVLLYLEWRRIGQGKDSVVVRSHKKFIWLPVLSYLVIDVLDFLVRVKHFDLKAEGVTGMAFGDQLNVIRMLSSVWDMAVTGLAGMFLPAFIKMKLWEFNVFSWGAVDLHNGIQIINAGFLLLGAGLVVLSGVILGRKRILLRDYRDRVSFKYGVFMLALVLSYIILFCVMRMQTMPHYIKYTPHHFYTVYMFTLIAAGFLGFSFLEAMRKESRLFAISFSLAVSLLIVLQASASYQVNRTTMGLDNAQRLYIKAISDFVRKHKHEKDFTFAVDFSNQRHYVLTRSAQESRLAVVPLDTMLFRKYIAENPKYYIVYSRDQGLRQFSGKSDALAYEQTLKDPRGKYSVWFNRYEFELTDAERMRIDEELPGWLTKKESP